VIRGAHSRRLEHALLRGLTARRLCLPGAKSITGGRPPRCAARVQWFGNDLLLGHLAPPTATRRLCEVLVNFLRNLADRARAGWHGDVGTTQYYFPDGHPFTTASEGKGSEHETGQSD
jgi:hypothetical protein